MSENAVAAFSSSTTGLTVSLDASASKGSFEAPLREYSWLFGDGRGETSNGPKISVRYAKAGEYVVQLTIVDRIGKKATTEKKISVIGTAAPAPTAKKPEAPAKAPEPPKAPSAPGTTIL